MKKNQTNEDQRLEEISNLLIQYSLGNFDLQLPLSSDGDDIDAIIAGVNMLGEELRHVTISRDYLSRVYNSIAEMLIVADISGVIEDVNAVACEQIEMSKYDLLGKNLFDFLVLKGPKNMANQQELLIVQKDKMVMDGELLNNSNLKLKCNFTTLRDISGEPSGILLIAEDVTSKLATEKLVIRTIIDTQEKERNRFASDLHDSLGQQLSGIRFYISALQNGIGEDEKLNLQFTKTLRSIDNAIIELRDICFNLMPRTLENHTLKYSLGELASKYNLGESVVLKISYFDSVPQLTKAFEIACFRIVQEFLNNAMKHGKATEVHVALSVDKKTTQLKILLQENGKGFNVNSLIGNTGMGLRNIKTRVESYYGTLDIASQAGKGTSMVMRFPIAFVILQ
jgi:PAS domain S-box-containing protein